MNLYDFLNSQSGLRLLFYGLLFIIAFGFITSMVESIFKSIFFNRKFKNVDKTHDDRSAN